MLIRSSTVWLLPFHSFVTTSVWPVGPWCTGGTASSREFSTGAPVFSQKNPTGYVAFDRLMTGWSGGLVLSSQVNVNCRGEKGTARRRVNVRTRFYASYMLKCDDAVPSTLHGFQSFVQVAQLALPQAACSDLTCHGVRDWFRKDELPVTPRLARTLTCSHGCHDVRDHRQHRRQPWHATHMCNESPAGGWCSRPHIPGTVAFSV